MVVEAREIQSPPGVAGSTPHERLRRGCSGKECVGNNASGEARLAGLLRLIGCVAVAESLVCKPAVQVPLSHPRRGYHVVRNRAAHIRESVSQLLYLDVEARLVVAGEFFGVGVRVVSAGGHECLSQDRLMAAEHARIIVRDDCRFAEVIEAE